jgi:kynurenine formamidase
MRQTFIDLAVPIKNNSFEPVPPEIEYFDHSQGAVNFGKRYGLQPSDFPNSNYCAVERITLGTHSGTHVDAPWHYGPLCEGTKSRTIDQMPLDWFMGNGVVLDFSDRPAGYGITEADVKEALGKIKYTLKPKDIVLIRTDNLKRYGDMPENWQLQPGMTRESTIWLVKQGVRLVGIDAYSWDRPSKYMLEDFKRGMPEKFFEAHFAGCEFEYCQIEKLCNLDLIPKPHSFTVVAFPVKVLNGSAGWARPVAIIDEQ